MVNIEEFRASLTMRRETMLRMAKRALAGGYKNAWSYYRGYERGLRCALEYLETVEPGDEALASSRNEGFALGYANALSKPEIDVVRARAWDEGFRKAMWVETGEERDPRPTGSNPYRAEREPASGGMIKFWAPRVSDDPDSERGVDE